MTGDKRGTAAATQSRVPRITTRGCYDLTNGRALCRRASYRLYPKRYFEDHVCDMPGASELIIMVHGLRNDDRGASAKTLIAQDMLRRLGHTSHRVVGFSYDSNTRGAHIMRYRRRAIAAGRRIAKANGGHLAAFLLWFGQNGAGRGTKRVRLLGHSLGSEVIYHAVMRLARESSPPPKRSATRGIIESVHFFGSSLPADIQKDAKVRRAIDHVIGGRLVNCYAPTDDVLMLSDSGKPVACDSGDADARPLGLCGDTSGTTAAKYAQKQTRPANHRFASYADALRSFP